MRLRSKSLRRRPRIGALLSSLCVSLALSASLFAAAAGSPAAPTVATAYPVEAVEAVFLYRFAGYVQWPPPAASSPRFTIAVLGADKVAAELREVLPNHPIQGKPAEVHSIRSVSQIGDAQMLYVGAGYNGNLRAVIDALHGRPVLVVTDKEDGLEAGSTVNFLLIDRHVRFEISTAAARRAGLKISAALLAVATRVRALNMPLYRPCSRDTACLSLVARR